jgi:hypothetical protein
MAMSKDNADGGYGGFHEFHRGGLNSNAKGVAFKKAPDSGPHTLGKAEGKMPAGTKFPTTSMKGKIEEKNREKRTVK